MIFYNIYIYNTYKIWRWLRGSELAKTKIFRTSFGRGHFQGNLLKF